MFEGKHIHFSQTDQKPLCSFSGKICNQRRLNNYGFCVRHILEDSSAPFKRCAYVAKSSRQTCTQPIPKTEERLYCNNHMQVLGMLPKKERKPKLSKSSQIACGHVGAMSDPGLLQNKLKLSQNSEDMVLKSSMVGHRITAGNEDIDDIYAFPADSDKSTREFTALLNNQSVSIVGPGNVSYGASVKSNNDSSSGTSSLAKIYPELAEKLEKIKPKIDTKVKAKGKISRTMNSLQNKIAQNKIKDKLKRTQSSSNTSSQSQSPSHSFLSSSPGYHVNTSSPNHVVQHLSTHNERLLPIESPVSHDGRNSSQLLQSTKNQISSSSALPSLSNVNILNGLNLQSLNLSLEQLGLPVPSVSDIEQTLKQFAKAANISLEGTTQTDEKASQPFKQTVGTEFIQPIVPPASLPNFPHLSGPPPPYSGVHHKPSPIVMHTASATLTNSPVKADPAIGVQAVPTASGNFSTVPVPLVTRQLFSSVPQAVSMSVPLPSVTSSALSSLPTLSSLTSAFSFASTMHPKLTLLTTSQPSSTVIANSNQVVTKSCDTVKPTLQSLPTSPAKPRPVKAKTKSRNSSAVPAVKRSVPMFTMSMTMVKPRKLRKVLDEHDKKMMKKNARDLYERNIKRSIDHHHMIYSGVVSSDDSDVSDCDMLPWQFDWLTPSSDEEPVDDEDNDYTLRTAKLAIGRARRRRQCFQARHSMRQDSHEDDVLCLVKAARESVRSSVLCLKEIAGKRKKSVERHTRTSLQKRRCLYRDSDDIQCKHVVVPYTNHCNRHVMYNVDQQLFEYCTAKFADNTQCCRPVIDVKHELPLCIEHGRKADNFLKSQDLEPKPKKPRKKTKPSALTRPPKKGKKKKNQRRVPQEQEVVQLSEDAADTDVLESSEENMPQHKNDARPQSNYRHKQERPPLPQATTIAVTMAQTRSSVVVNTTASFVGLDSTASHVISDSLKKVKVPDMAAALGGQGVSQEVKTGQLKTHAAAFGQLEELDQLAGLELENVRMFGELETASKLLEMNDFQDVFNKLPDEAFDIFSSKAGSLTSTDDLQAFEDSLALANREMNAGKDSHGLLPPSSTHLQTTRTGGRRAPTAAILEDDLTRQIAEEVLQQNLGPDIGSHLGDSMCNGDAEESIKAIARSLSNTGMMLAAEAKQKSQDHDLFGAHSYGANQYGRSSSLPSYNTLEYFPPNVSVQNIPMSSSNVSIGNASVTLGVDVSKVTVPQVFPGHTQVSVIPQNVTVTPQGIITTHIPNVSDINMANRKPGLTPFSQTVTIGNATVTGNQSSGTITLPGSQQLTAQQLSALVQQAAAHLPPLPPYKPRQQTLTNSNMATQQQLTQIAIRPVMVTSSAASIVFPVGEMKTVPIAFTAVSSAGQAVPNKHSGQENLIQHLTRQQEQLGQQQQLLAQQILQQRISALNCGPLRVTLPSAQNLGFSTILQQGQIGQLGTMSASLVQAVPISGQVTRHNSNSTSQSGSSQSGIPSTNILWTSPPNVTITTQNGVPRPAPQQKNTNSTNLKIATLLPSSGSSLKETFIDLTDSDPPSYEATQVVMGKTQPPPSYPVPSPAVTSDTAMS